MARYDKYEKLKLQYTYGPGEGYWIDVEPPQFKAGELIESNSPDCGYHSPIYRWFTVPDEYLCEGYNKYYKVVYQVSTDEGLSWTNVSPEQTKIGELIEANSYDCDYGVEWVVVDNTFICEETSVNVQYRWFVWPDDYICNKYDKCTKEVYQRSIDNGKTWENVEPYQERPGAVIEKYSTDCGCIFEWRVYPNKTICVGKNKYFQEVYCVSIDGLTWEYVQPLQTRTGELIQENADECTIPTIWGYSSGCISIHIYKYEKVCPGIEGRFGSGAEYLEHVLNEDEINHLNDDGNLGNIFRENGGLTTFEPREVHFTNFEEIALKSTNSMFNSCANLEIIDISSLNTENVTNMGYMFYGCRSLNSLDLKHFKTDSAIYMNYMFADCQSITDIDLTSFNTENVTNMMNMFSSCESLRTVHNLSSIKLKNNVNMSEMFRGCTSLNTLDSWSFNDDTIGSMTSMFARCEALENVNISFNNCSIGDMSSMFAGCDGLENVNISFNNCSIGDMSQMFRALRKNCDIESATINISLTAINMQSDTKMNELFSLSYGIQNIDLTNFDLTHCTSLSGMFDRCNNLKTVAFGDLSNIRILTDLFHGCISIETIDFSSTNLINVESMFSTFYGCRRLHTINFSNCDLSKVDTSGSRYCFRDTPIKTIIANGCNEQTISILRSLLDSEGHSDTEIIQ